MQHITIDGQIRLLHELIEEARANTKLDVEKRAKIIERLIRTQFAGATLKLNMVKAMSRLPENAPASLQLTGAVTTAEGSAAK